MSNSTSLLEQGQQLLEHASSAEDITLFQKEIEQWFEHIKNTSIESQSEIESLQLLCKEITDTINMKRGIIQSSLMKIKKNKNQHQAYLNTSQNSYKK